MVPFIEMYSVPAIAAIVYAVMDVLKIATQENKTFMRLIPLLSLILGLICGLVAFYTVPGYLDTSNAVIAMVVGGASGLSATGVNQVFKQISKKVAENKEKKEEIVSELEDEKIGIEKSKEEPPKDKTQDE